MTTPVNRRAINLLLWTLQCLLAALFLFAGVMKLAMPIEMMTKQIPLSGAFLRFIGIAETLGAIGLTLPWGLRIRRELTPLAAVGLIVIMAGATILTLRLGGWAQALMPFAVGCLLASVAYGRWSSRLLSPVPGSASDGSVSQGSAGHFNQPTLTS